MTTSPDWLPALVLFNRFDGNWERYVEALYAYFKHDFVDSSPKFQGVQLALKRYPMALGKESTFWHLISEGDVEPDRLPNLRRCERIRWPRPIIEHADTIEVKVWENQRRGETRICLWFEAVDYLVILALRKNYLLFWTAYPVTYSHTRRKLKKEYEMFKKANAAP